MSARPHAATRAGVRDAARGEVRNAVRGEVRDTARDEVRDAARGEIRDTARCEVRDAARREVRDTARGEVRDAARASVRARRPWSRRWRACAALCGLVLCSARGALADTPEPPPEAGEGDYTLEAADSLADDELELSVSAASDGGARVRRAQRIAFRGGGTSGTLRDGDDALSGGGVQAPFAGGLLAAGRLAPLWGRGLVLGGAAEPWARAADDRGARARYRGRAGQGIAFESGPAAVLAGRFAKRAFAGARLALGPVALGGLGARGEAQGSAAYERDGQALELALGAHGRWRAEAALASEVAGVRLALRIRGGLTTFRPLAEPARAGPPHALAAAIVHDLAPGAGTRAVRPARRRDSASGRVAAFGALWRWADGRMGARGALEVAAPMGDHEAFACGVEEQHGARREPTPRTRAAGTRQGLWCEWRGDTPAARLSLRHELWGARAFARSAVRRAVVARAEWAAARGGRVAVTHAVWLVRRGEQLYLPEPEADRLVLRALGGDGTRTRAELRLPFAAGDIRLGLTVTTGGTRAGTQPPAWTVEWSRRARMSGARQPPGRGDEHEIRGTDGTAHDRGVVRHAGARQGARSPGS